MRVGSAALEGSQRPYLANCGSALVTMGAPWFVPTALLFGAALAQASLVPFVAPPGVRLDLVLVLVVIWGILRGPREGLVWAFIGGVCLDLTSGGPWGTAPLALVVVAFCTSVGEVNLFKSSVLLPVLIVFWATIFFALVYLFLLRSQQFPVDWLGMIRTVIIPSAILNAVSAVPAYYVLSRLERRTRSVPVVEW